MSERDPLAENDDFADPVISIGDKIHITFNNAGSTVSFHGYVLKIRLPVRLVRPNRKTIEWAEVEAISSDGNQCYVRYLAGNPSERGITSSKILEKKNPITIGRLRAAVWEKNSHTVGIIALAILASLALLLQSVNKLSEKINEAKPVPKAAPSVPPHSPYPGYQNRQSTGTQPALASSAELLEKEQAQAIIQDVLWGAGFDEIRERLKLGRQEAQEQRDQLTMARPPRSPPSRISTASRPSNKPCCSGSENPTTSRCAPTRGKSLRNISVRRPPGNRSGRSMGRKCLGRMHCGVIVMQLLFFDKSNGVALLEEC